MDCIELEILIFQTFPSVSLFDNDSLFIDQFGVIIENVFDGGLNELRNVLDAVDFALFWSHQAHSSCQVTCAASYI